MRWEINVSRYNQHVFATHERSLTDNLKAIFVYDEIAKRFPKEEGFEVTMTRHEESNFVCDELHLVDMRNKLKHWMNGTAIDPILTF